MAIVGASALAASRLTLPETSFDFGYVPQHAKVSHVFWLKSTGDDSLKILKVIPGCGCTQVPLEKQELAAGDSTKLEVIFSTGSYTYRVTKQPKIQTNEGPPDKAVSILCNVVTRPDSTYPLVIDPYKLDLTQFGDSVRDRMSFQIRNVSDQKLDLSLVSLPSDFFTVSMPATVEPGRTIEARIKLNKTALNKDFDKSFTIELSDQGHTRFTVPVKRDILPSTQADVSAMPDSH